jgi:putative heme-binding domain-containing protein
MTHARQAAVRAFVAAAVLTAAIPIVIRAAQAPAGAPAAPMPPGDAARGKTLVESNGCLDCHRIGERGSHASPDLTDVGGRRTPDRLRQALVAPDDEVLAENRSVRIVTKEGATVTGRILNQDAVSVQLITAKDELKRYLRAGLREYAIVDKGLMPSSQGKLTDQQVNDIVNYLGSLK